LFYSHNLNPLQKAVSKTNGEAAEPRR